MNYFGGAGVAGAGADGVGVVAPGAAGAGVAALGAAGTGAAGAGNRGQIQIVVEPSDTRDIDWLRIEERLTTQDAGTRVVFRFISGLELQIRPGIVQAEDHGRERDAMWIPPSGSLMPT